MREVKAPLTGYYIGYFIAAGNDRLPQVREPAELALALYADKWGEYIKQAMREKMAAAGRTGLTDAKCEAKLTALDRELLDLELVEESLIRTAERGGFAIPRRHDANPLAVLADDSVLPE
jgi:hypothetical protein